MNPPLAVETVCVLCGYLGTAQFHSGAVTVQHDWGRCELPPRDIPHPPTLQAAKPIERPWALRGPVRASRVSVPHTGHPQRGRQRPAQRQHGPSHNRGWTA